MEVAGFFEDDGVRRADRAAVGRVRSGAGSDPVARRAVFLDFDGTLADRGRVPSAHVDAIRQARARGHLVLLCTGRSSVMLPPEVRTLGLDGIVASAGCYVQVGDRVLVDRRFPAGLAARTVAVLDELDVPYILEAPDAVYGRPAAADRLRARFAGLADDPQEAVRAFGATFTDDLAGVSFAKVSCFDPVVPVAELARRIGPELASVPSSLPGHPEAGGELYLRDVHKATGAELAARELGVPRERVVAVGDAMNDLELLEFAGLAVAVAGSDPRLQAVADRLAAPPSRAGLAALFDELGLTRTA